MENLRRTKKALALFGRSAPLVCADSMLLPFADASFEAVYSFGVIHHTPIPSMAIREVHRVLRPEGSLGLMLYHRWLGTYAEKLRAFVNRRLTEEGAGALVFNFSKKELEEMLADFEIERIRFEQPKGTGRYLLERVYWKVQRFLPKDWRDYALMACRKRD